MNLLDLFEYHRDDEWWKEGHMFTLTGNRINIAIPKQDQGFGITVYFWPAPAPVGASINWWDYSTLDQDGEPKPTYSERWDDLDELTVTCVMIELLQRDGTDLPAAA